MTDTTTADAFTRELRIAPVMTGGTSLAVWMGGVTAELYRVLMSTRDRDDPTTAVYRALLDLTNTEARIDVVTGTSAGGLNGSLISAAWRLNLPTERVLAMRDVWMALGDINNLIRKPTESSPPSLLQGDAYFVPRLEGVLDAWYHYERATAEDRPIDLMISVTTVNGEPRTRFDHFGQELGEVDHRQTINLVRNGGVRVDGEMRYAYDDFEGRSWIKPMARAARTSASIPGVFEASFLPVEGSDDGAHAEHARFARTQVSFGKSRWAVDGGVVNNLPLEDAIDRIFRQRAERDIRRVVLYVKPTPSIPPVAEVEHADEGPSAFAALRVVSNARKAEGIAADVDRIHLHNLGAVRQRSARFARLRADRDVNPTPEARRVWDVFLALRASQSVARMIDGTTTTNPFVLSRQLDLEDALRTPRIAGLPASADALEGGTPAGSTRPPRPWGWGLAALEYGVALAMSLASDALNLPVPEEGIEGAGARREAVGASWVELHEILDQVRAVRVLDSAFWQHRLEQLAGLETRDQLRTWAEHTYDDWPYTLRVTDAETGPDGRLETTPPNPYVVAKTALQDPRPEWFGTAQEADSSDRLLEYLLDLGLRLAQVVHDMQDSVYPLAVEALRAAITVGGELDPADVVRAADEDLRMHFDPARSQAADSSAHELSPRAREIIELALYIAEQMTRLRATVGSSGTLDDYRGVLLQLLALHVLDTVYQGGTTTNEQVLELLQVSWDAPNAIDPRRPDDKLAGTEFSRLGAFLKRSWRANDWMWGRLDGAHRMLLMLLDPTRLRQLRRSKADVLACVRQLACGASDELPDGDPVLRTEWEHRRPAVEKELAFLGVDDAPTPAALPHCVDAVAYALQTQICQEEIPGLYDAVVVSRDQGGAEGDDGQFRVLYQRKVRHARTRRVTDHGDRVETPDVPELLRAVRIGEERAGDEIGHDLLTRTATQAAAVAIKMASGERSGASWAARFARPLRAPAMVLYALARGMTTRSRTAVALVITALTVSGAILGLWAADNDVVSTTIATVAGVVFVAGTALAVVRSGWVIGTPIVLAVTVIVATLLGGRIKVFFFGTAADAESWKRVIFINPLSASMVVVLTLVIFWTWTLVRSIADRYRRRPGRGVTQQEWSLLDRTEYYQQFRRAVALVLLGPAVLLGWMWLMSELTLGTRAGDPVKAWIVDAAKWLHAYDALVVAVALAVLGALIGIGWDRVVGPMTASARRRVGAPFRRLAQRSSPEGTPATDQVVQSYDPPLPHPWSRLTSAQRWALFGASLVAVVGFGAWLGTISIPQGRAVEFQLAGAPGAADWLEGDRTDNVWSLLVDYPFLVAYGIGLSMLLAFFASVWHRESTDEHVTSSPAAREHAHRAMRFASYAAWVPLAAATFDAIENGLLLGYLGGRSDWAAAAARGFSVAKWGALALTALLVVTSAVLWFVHFCARRTRRWNSEGAAAVDTVEA